MVAFNILSFGLAIVSAAGVSLDAGMITELEPVELVGGLAGDAFGHDFDLLSFISSVQFNLKNKVATPVVNVLEKYKTAGHCHKDVVSKLINDCSTFVGTNDGTKGSSSESVKSKAERINPTKEHELMTLVLFRIAITACEHEPIGTPFLGECAPAMKLVKHVQDGQKCSFFGSCTKSPDPAMSKHDKEKVSHCLSAMRNDPSYWTSYSNAGQDARAICDAFKPNVDYDHFLDTLSVLSTQVVSSTTTLRDQTSMLMETLKAELKARQLMESSLKSFLDSFDEQSASSSSALASLSDQIGMLGKPMREVNHNLESFVATIHSAHDSTVAMLNNIAVTDAFARSTMSSLNHSALAVRDVHRASLDLAHTASQKFAALTSDISITLHGVNLTLGQVNSSLNTLFLSIDHIEWYAGWAFWFIKAAIFIVFLGAVAGFVSTMGLKTFLCRQRRPKPARMNPDEIELDAA